MSSDEKSILPAILTPRLQRSAIRRTVVLSILKNRATSDDPNKVFKADLVFSCIIILPNHTKVQRSLQMQRDKNCQWVKTATNVSCIDSREINPLASKTTKKPRFGRLGCRAEDILSNAPAESLHVAVSLSMEEFEKLEKRDLYLKERGT